MLNYTWIEKGNKWYIYGVYVNVNNVTHTQKYNPFLACNFVTGTVTYMHKNSY